jgi:hypothetical protein
MQIIIEIDKDSTDEIMLAIAAALGTPRGNPADTSGRVKIHMLKTVGEWFKRGMEIITREQTEAATAAAIAEKVKITIQ